MIRHGSGIKNWDDMDYSELIRLIRQEKDLELDLACLKSINFDILRNLEPELVICSPMTRTLETAKFIAKELGLEYQIDNSLQEIHFEDLPKSKYENGPKQMIDYLFEKSLLHKNTFDCKKVQGNVIIVTHSFLMRLIYADLFNVDVSTLKDDLRFKTYLAGFALGDGKGVFLRKK